MTEKCPKEGCDKEAENGFNLALHWGHSHEGSLPDHIDTSRPDEHRKSISESIKGRSLSEEHKQAIREGATPPVIRALGQSEHRDRSEYNQTLIPSRKEEIRVALGNRCQAYGCNKRRSGSNRRLDVAHIDQDPENNEPANLTVLCRSCHHRLDFYDVEPADIEMTLADT